MSECGKCGNKAIMSYHYFCYKCGNSLNENGIDLSDIEKELEGLVTDNVHTLTGWRDVVYKEDIDKLLSRIRDNKKESGDDKAIQHN